MSVSIRYVVWAAASVGAIVFCVGRMGALSAGPRVSAVPATSQAQARRPAGLPPPAAAPAPSGPAPRIVFAETQFEFGEVLEGTLAEHAFSFQNKGEGVLRILGVTTTCGCTAAIPDVPETAPGVREVAPGGAGNIKVTFNSDKRPGDQRKQVTVQSNDPTQPALPLQIHALVRPVFAFEPPALDFGPIERGQEVVREIVMRDTKGKPFKIEALTFTHTDIKASEAPQDGGDGSVRRIRVTLKSGGNPGPLYANVMVRTDREKLPPVMLVVQAMLQGKVTINPPFLFLGNVRSGEAFRPDAGRVIVKNNGQSPAEIQSIDTGVPWLKAAVTPVTAGWDYAIQFTVDPLPPPGHFAQKVRILMTDSDMPHDVTVSGAVLNAAAGAPQPPPPVAPQSPQVPRKP